MGNRIGFATSEEDPALTRDDLLSTKPLAALGFRIEPVIWDHGVNLSAFDALVCRSCWNYHRKPDAFLAWLDRLKALQVPVFNPPDVSAWNLHKRYLLELRTRGVALADTVLIAQGASAVDGACDSIQADELVIKPAISLNGHDTYRVSRTDTERRSSLVRELASRGDVVVQEFLPEIATAGEISFVFFNGVFSHAIRKLPTGGEFRTQVEHGGERVPVQPSSDLIAQAEKVLRAVPVRLLFARVDAVERDGQLLLMELELIDPMLFLEYAVGAPERFAQAIAAALA